MADTALQLSGLRKSFGKVAVLAGLDLDVGKGEFISLLGPSGCGKTTTLNIIAGFETPDEGDVLVDAQSILNVPVHRRDLGMVFQSHGLFPHMTVADNVGFGLKMKKLASAEIARRVKDALALVHLENLASRYPRELSGGQQQRVGLARALTVRPRLILLDEPLSSLDAKLRREMALEIRRIQKEVGITALYVTHDQEEAMTLSDRIVLMNGGRIEQQGTPEDVYSRPATEFAAGFIGEASFVTARVVETDQKRTMVVIGSAAPIPVSPREGVAVGDRLRLCVRPDRVRLEPRGGQLAGELPARLEARAFLGTVNRLVLRLEDGSEILAVNPAAESPAATPGEMLGLHVEADDWHVLGKVQ